MRSLEFSQQICRCLYTGLTSPLHGCSVLSQRLGTTPMAPSESLRTKPHQHAKGCRDASTTAQAMFLKTCFDCTNDPHSTNCTAAQRQLRKGYCLKHAPNRWRYGLLHNKAALNVYMVVQRGLKHKLDAFAVARIPPTRPPLAERNTNFGKAGHAGKLPKLTLCIKSMHV